MSSASSRSSVLNEAVRIESISHDGRGIARVNGKTLFVDGALPDESVQVRVLENKRRFANASVKTVVSASPQRCEPTCRHFRQCGGCSLQYWSYDGQLSAKQGIVLDQLARFASVAPEHLEAPLSSSPYGYRHRCRFAIRWRKGRLQLGFREKGSNAICDIIQCPVLAAPLQEIPSLLRALLPTLKNATAISHAECFLARNGRGLLLRHIRPLPGRDQQLLREFAAEHQLLLYLQGDPNEVELFYPSPLAKDTAMYYDLSAAGLKLYFRPQDFTQVNASINEAMVAQALEWLMLKPSDRVLDLFCGLGNFSLPIAQFAQHVTAVEGAESSVQQAKLNGERNGLHNLSFYCADLAADCSGEAWAKAGYDIVVLDPPRAGADFVITQLAEFLPNRLLYISCNPATLARDAGILAAYGFRLLRLNVMDMFPHTAHVESMALFIR